MRINTLLIISFIVGLVSCSGKVEKIKSVNDLRDKRICILMGSAGDITARTNFPDARVIDMIAAADAALSVKNNKADAFIHNKTILQNIVEKDQSLTILEPPVAKVPIAAALNKKSLSLLEEINGAISTLKENGTLEQMKNKWLNTDNTTILELPKQLTNNNAEELILGTCAQSEPLSFVQNNEIIGLDIELAIHIGNILNKKIRIMDMAFEGLIPALQAGKIDFALGDFNVTEERKKYINYSEEYMKDDISALVRK